MAELGTIPGVSDEDLKALIAAGAIPATSLPSVSGAAQPAAPSTIPFVSPARASMSPVQRKNLALDLATSGHNAIPAVVPSRQQTAPNGMPTVGAAPDLPAAAPDTSALGAGIPSLARPTTAQ